MMEDSSSLSSASSPSQTMSLAQSPPPSPRDLILSNPPTPYKSDPSENNPSTHPLIFATLDDTQNRAMALLASKPFSPSARFIVSKLHIPPTSLQESLSLTKVLSYLPKIVEDLRDVCRNLIVLKRREDILSKKRDRDIHKASVLVKKLVSGNNAEDSPTTNDDDDVIDDETSTMHKEHSMLHGDVICEGDDDAAKLVISIVNRAHKTLALCSDDSSMSDVSSSLISSTELAALRRHLQSKTEDKQSLQTRLQRSEVDVSAASRRVTELLNLISNDTYKKFSRSGSSDLRPRAETVTEAPSRSLFRVEPSRRGSDADRPRDTVFSVISTESTKPTITEHVISAEPTIIIDDNKDLNNFCVAFSDMKHCIKAVHDQITISQLDLVQQSQLANQNLQQGILLQQQLDNHQQQHQLQQHHAYQRQQAIELILMSFEDREQRKRVSVPKEDSSLLKSLEQAERDRVAAKHRELQVCRELIDKDRIITELSATVDKERKKRVDAEQRAADMGSNWTREMAAVSTLRERLERMERQWDEERQALSTQLLHEVRDGNSQRHAEASRYSASVLSYEERLAACQNKIKELSQSLKQTLKAKKEVETLAATERSVWASEKKKIQDQLLTASNLGKVAQARTLWLEENIAKASNLEFDYVKMEGQLSVLTLEKLDSQLINDREAFKKAIKELNNEIASQFYESEQHVTCALNLMEASSNDIHECLSSIWSEMQSGNYQIENYSELLKTDVLSAKEQIIMLCQRIDDFIEFEKAKLEQKHEIGVSLNILNRAEKYCSSKTIVNPRFELLDRLVLSEDSESNYHHDVTSNLLSEISFLLEENAEVQMICSSIAQKWFAAEELFDQKMNTVLDSTDLLIGALLAVIPDVSNHSTDIDRVLRLAKSLKMVVSELLSSFQTKDENMRTVIFEKLLSSNNSVNNHFYHDSDQNYNKKSSDKWSIVRDSVFNQGIPPDITPF